MSSRAVAVGVFDGVHVGHRRVLDALRRADERGVVTFDPHPVAGTLLLSTLERRVELLREAGVDDVAVVPPDASLDDRLAGATLVTGPTPARIGAGDVVVVPLAEGVSSQRIRQLVGAGELVSAAQLLGRPFEIEGVVVEGDRRGHGLGFPTANLRIADGLVLPPRGIYAGAALGHRAAISIGVNPHYRGTTLRVEAFLLDFDGDLYGQALRLELWQFLREEAAFASERALVEAIQADVDAARAASRPE